LANAWPTIINGRAQRYARCTHLLRQAGCLDGDGPLMSTLVQATNGSFCGTTSGNGANAEGTKGKLATNNRQAYE